MLRLKILLWLFASLVIALAFAGCLPTTSSSPIQTQTIQATQVNTPAFAGPTGEPADLELDRPFWIGRGKIVSAMFLPGAEQAAIAWGGGVSLHTVETGEEIWFQSVSANVIAFDVQTQGNAFAAALTDGSVMIFEAASGASQRVEGARPNAYWGDIAWSPDGGTIAFQFIGPNRSDPIYLLDVASGRIGQVPNSQTGEGVMPQLVWSPDGSAITVAALGDTCSRFVDIRTGEERMRLGNPGQCYGPASLLFLPDGETVAVQTRAGGLDLLRFPDGVRIRTLQSTGSDLISGHLEFPAADEALFIDPEGVWIANRGGYEPCSCGNPQDQPDHPLIVWDLARGDVQARLDQALDPLTQRQRLDAAFDGESILIFYASGEITRWMFNDTEPQEVLVSPIPVRPLSAWTLNWSTDGSHLAFTGSYGGVDVYQTDTALLVQRFDPPWESLALSPDGRLVALFDPDRELQSVYEVQSGQRLHALPASPVLMGPAFSPDGRYLAYADETGASITDLESGEVTALDAAPVTADMALTRIIWSPDGDALVTAYTAASPGSGGPGVIVLWQRLGNGAFEAIHHATNVQADYTLPNLALAGFNPSGSRVALQSMREPEAAQTDVVVYDLESGKVIQTFREYTLAVWINDQELLAAEAQYDTRLTRIDVISGEKSVGGARELGGNAYAPGGLFAAQMAPSGRGVRVLHWQSGEIVARVAHEALNLIDYRWSPDGRWLASIGSDGTLRVWRVRMY
ncbi:MAG TPA: WD40 repeat domain-containing protein [Anaerolineales bacterium]|nr:WD40 repeat domain-containing protein [Anaerolineales bacterium]